MQVRPRARRGCGAYISPPARPSGAALVRSWPTATAEVCRHLRSPCSSPLRTTVPSFGSSERRAPGAARPSRVEISDGASGTSAQHDSSVVVPRLVPLLSHLLVPGPVNTAVQCDLFAGPVSSHLPTQRATRCSVAHVVGT